MAEFPTGGSPSRGRAGGTRGSDEAPGRGQRFAAVLASLLGGLLCGPLGGVWPGRAELVLTQAERWEAGRLTGLAGLIVALGVFLLSGGRAVWGGLVLPAAALALWARLPLRGEAWVRAEAPYALVALLIVILGAAGLRTRSGRVALPLVASLGLLWSFAADYPRMGSGPAPDRPPILVISLDTVRADHLFGLGPTLTHTPHLQALAKEARVYRAAYSPVALTGPAHISLFSGRSPLHHGVLENGVRVPDGLPWLPERLAAAGWRTRGIVSAAVLSAELGFSRGFAEFDGVFFERVRRGHPLIRPLGFRPKAAAAFQRSGAETAELFTSLSPLGPGSFTWVHLYDAHWPYLAEASALARVGLPAEARIGTSELAGRPSPELVERGRALYAAQFEALDAAVGRILAKVPEDATIVVVGDHGESLGEHGIWWNHGTQAGEAETHVPLLIRTPGLEPGFQDGLVSITGLAGFLGQVAGLGEVSEWDGLGDQPVISVVGRRAMGPARCAWAGGEGPWADRMGLGAIQGAVIRGERGWFWADCGRVPQGMLPPGLPEGGEADGWVLSPGEPGWEALSGVLGPAGPDKVDVGIGGTEADRSPDGVDPGSRAALEALGYVEGSSPREQP